MAQRNRSIILKGIFAVAVVAVTATVGVIGFAQAAPRPAALNVGYGGGAGAILAAIREFQDALRTAGQQFQEDIQACLDGNRRDLSARGVAPANPQVVAADDAYRQTSQSSLNGFSAKLASPSAIGSTQSAFNQHFDAATKTSQQGLDSAETQLNNAMDRISANRNRSALSQCLRDARNDYRSAVQAARQKLLAALRDILH